jgi:hypothetical protein
MPSKSKAQHNLMAMVANDPKAAKRLGIPQSVGRDYVKADKGRKFGSGGSMKESKAMMRKEVAFMKKKGAPKSMIRHEEEEMRGGGKGKVKKFSNGRLVPNPNVANPNIKIVPGINGGYKGSYQTPIEIQRLQSFGKDVGMSPHRYEEMVNKLIEKGERAPQAIKEAGQKALSKGIKLGGAGGAALGALGTAYGPQIVERFSALAGRKKPSVTVTDEQGQPVPQGKAHGGQIKSKGGFRRQADGVAHKGKTKGRVVKMAGGGMAYSSGGSVYRKGADGIASKGKTKGRMVKMAYGGKC